MENKEGQHLTSTNFKKNIMKNLFIATLLLLSTFSFGQSGLGEVIGTVQKDSTGEIAYDAIAYINDNGNIYRARTGFDGRFRIPAIPAGTYLLNVRQGQDTVKNIVVNVPIDGFHQTGVIVLRKNVQVLTGVVVSIDRNGPRLIDGNLPVKTLSALEIKRSPLKFDVKGLISTMSSDIKMTNDGELVFRGARKGDMLYLMDGVKTATVGAVPGCSIGRMMVYTGGLPAKYGDTMGGVVIMESKSYFDLFRSWKAQQL